MTHLQYPVQFAGSGFATVAQDSVAEVTGCVDAILACPLGAIPEIPTFGVPDVTFQPAPINWQPVISAVRQLEPRATDATIEQAMTDNTGGSWIASLTARTPGTVMAASTSTSTVSVARNMIDGGGASASSSSRVDGGDASATFSDVIRGGGALWA